MSLPTDINDLVLYLQAALGFVGFVTIIERLIFFQHARSQTADLLLGITNHVREDAHAEALHEASRARGPEARIIQSVLLRHELDRTNLREIAQEAGQLEVPRVERNLRVLLGVSMLAPLLGMFGTVLGLLGVFANLTAVDVNVAQAALANGMFHALTSTAVGLGLAVVAYLFYLYLFGKARRVIHRMERAGIEIVNIVCDSQEQKGR